MGLIDDLKKFAEEVILPKFDLKDLGREALEVVAFVLINRLREVAKLIPGSLDDELVEKLAEQADKIDPATKRA